MPWRGARATPDGRRSRARLGASAHARGALPLQRGPTGPRSARREGTRRPTSSGDVPVAIPGGTIAGDDERDRASGSGPVLEGLDGSGSDLSRILSLSDGVFAFALTFLAVSLLLPQVTSSGPRPSLPTYLGRLEPAFLGYALTFFVIASWWRVHHRLFSAFARYDSVIVRLNSFFLLVISVTPFLVSILFAYGPSDFGPGSISSRLAVALYGAVEGLGGLVLLAIWRHGTHAQRLVRASVTDEWVRATERNQLLTVAVFAVSTGLAFVLPLVSELTWVFMVLGFGRRFLQPGPARRRPASAGPPA